MYLQTFIIMTISMLLCVILWGVLCLTEVLEIFKFCGLIILINFVLDLVRYILEKMLSEDLEIIFLFIQVVMFIILVIKMPSLYGVQLPKEQSIISRFFRWIVSHIDTPPVKTTQ